ncbi:hypothetical protein EDB87DRAFT_1025010 [Lactarius vividus]|nr:hypothetical protein EDB87DRAFT_1025010 [Lactarius vividus]
MHALSHIITHDASADNTALYRRGLDSKMIGINDGADKLIGRDDDVTGVPPSKLIGRDDDVTGVPPSKLIGRDDDVTGVPPSKLIGRDDDVTGVPPSKLIGRDDDVTGVPPSKLIGRDDEEREPPTQHGPIDTIGKRFSNKLSGRDKVITARDD